MLNKNALILFIKIIYALCYYSGCQSIFQKITNYVKRAHDDINDNKSRYPTWLLLVLVANPDCIKTKFRK